MEGSHFPPLYLKNRGGEEKETGKFLERETKEKRKEGRAMEDLLTWLLSFFLLILLFCTIGFQLLCLTDLELDYANPYDSASKINRLLMPEFILQGIICFLHFIAGHWSMFFFSLPIIYYNSRQYKQRKHLIDVTEIYNQLSMEKNQRLFKLAAVIIQGTASIFWMLWTVLEDFH